ncbi:hypothetical protein [Serratia fonticola]|uniref:hypothetical protein n=1 Tax=Serratia fonticola TaxID=47917 RepID=UPI00301BB122
MSTVTTLLTLFQFHSQQSDAGFFLLVIAHQLLELGSSRLKLPLGGNQKEINHVEHFQHSLDWDILLCSRYVGLVFVAEDWRLA